VRKSAEAKNGEEGEKHDDPTPVGREDASAASTSSSSATDDPTPPSANSITEPEENDDIPVFAGFGSRPLGKIGIPGEVDEEGKFRAKGAEGLEQLGGGEGDKEDGEAEKKK
jgi:hypothetical protein